MEFEELWQSVYQKGLRRQLGRSLCLKLIMFNSYAIQKKKKNLHLTEIVSKYQLCFPSPEHSLFSQNSGYLFCFSCWLAPLACECLILISSVLHSGMSAKHVSVAIIELDIFFLSGRRFLSLCCSLASSLQGLL